MNREEKRYIRWLHKLFLSKSGKVVSKVKFKEPIVLHPGESVEFTYSLPEFFVTEVTKHPSNEAVVFVEEMKP